MKLRPLAALALAGAALAVSAAPADGKVQPPATAPSTVSTALPPELREVGFVQRLGDPIPLDLQFRDEENREVTLRRYFGKKPVVLALVYYQCPLLCTVVLNGLESSLRALELTVGQEFEVVTVSFDARERAPLAAAKKATILRSYARSGAGEGWHFLTGDQPSIDALTRAVGFRYVYDAKHDQFAHPAGIVVATPDGRIARYFYGADYPPRDLRLGLVEASEGKIGSPVDQFLLLCFHYDPQTGKYTAAIWKTMRLAGVGTVLVMAIAISLALVRERRRRSVPTEEGR